MNEFVVATDRNCHVCGASVEDLNHIIRLFPPASLVWRELIKVDRLSDFLSPNLVDWVSNNLTAPSRFAIDHDDYELLFGTILWNLWLAQNFKVFETPMDNGSSVIDRSKHLWSPQPAHWIKINTDGARRESDGSASCGGVARYSSGSWKFGFSIFIGACSVFNAELWGAAVGLDLAWNAGFR
ncbi:hypothetical protein F3Y22_tig00111582pilonHSYRG00728 [Hibiscus syriacus]|uniref:RNase H type-1 domain-containing protein n=1 Tax=Hibiscus syriacus TaxID=106335 RepID=A0A6A2YJP3_HIBSY|nr:hypothetical protein F3Y22_tig00111582pilonHSYRG00728 [Hibiscus syriacus]